MFSDYIVQVNDTVGDIAKKFGTSIQEIVKINSGLNFNNLIPGQVIKIPANISDAFSYYIVKKGDNLYKLANENDTDVNMLAQINGLNMYDFLHPGEQLMIPNKGVKLYITKEGDTLKSVSDKTKTNLNSLVAENANIYLLPEQLLIYRE